MEQLSQHKCRVNIRPTYKGKKAKPYGLKRNGEVHIFEVMWQMDNKDPYPDEYAMAIVDDQKRRKWLRQGFGWIASGDLEFL